MYEQTFRWMMYGQTDGNVFKLAHSSSNMNGRGAILIPGAILLINNLCTKIHFVIKCAPNDDDDASEAPDGYSER